MENFKLADLESNRISWSTKTAKNESGNKINESLAKIINTKINKMTAHKKNISKSKADYKTSKTWDKIEKWN